MINTTPRTPAVALLLLSVLATACDPPRCNDGIENGTETDLDCGGMCAPCITGATCGSGIDCVDGVCASGICSGDTCTDGVQNGDEAGIDCGGACGRCTQPACATAIICVRDFIPTTVGETIARANLPLSEIISDRVRYYRDDPIAQMVVLFFGQPINGSTTIRLTLIGTNPLVQQDVYSMTSPKLEVWLDLNNLATGSYTLRAELREGNGTFLSSAELPFSIDAGPEAHASFPEAGIDIVVPAQAAGFPASWPITTGIPLPRESVRDPGELLLVEDNVPVPMQATVRSRWQAGGSIAWVGLDFTARFRADGTPSQYRLVRARRSSSPAPSPQIVREPNPDVIIINTGPARFYVSPSFFAGVQQADLDLDGDGTFSATERVIDGDGGPYVVDEAGNVFSARNDSAVDVQVEEQGPLRMTIVARGEYKNASGTAAFNRFVSRLSFHAGRTDVMIDHRTIVTDDTRTARRIADAGWQVPVPQSVTSFRAGIDGSVIGGAAPATDETVFIHQDRSDRVRVQSGASGAVNVASGRSADGWLSAIDATSAVTVVLRDMRERFPKELELSNDASAPDVTHRAPGQRLLVHFWPRHGHTAFTPAEELAREEIHKMRWAHQGSLLDFNMPADYVTALEALHNTPGTRDYGWDTESMIWLGANANAQGVAFGGEVALMLQASPVDADALQAYAAAVTSPVHAMARPEWNAATRVEQALAPRDLVRFPKLERAIDLSHAAYVDAIVNGGDELGMWSYGNMHNSWDPSRDVPMLPRLWQNSHYRNVFAVWLQYFRSGDPATHAWARATSDTLIDLASVHHPKASGVPPGSVYHFGVLPWASTEVVLTAHWVDASAPVLRYLLTGDGRSLDAAQTWYRYFLERPIAHNPRLLQACPDYASDNFIRNYVVPFGELLYYYQLTRDAQALVAIYEFARYIMATRYECVQSPADHPVFHDQWYWRYYSLTRDERVIERLRDWSSAGYGNAGAGALLYRATGDVQYLERDLPYLYRLAQTVYENPGDRYHGYQEAFVPAVGKWAQLAPYWMSAAADAGFPWQSPGLTTAPIYPIHPSQHNWSYAVWPPAGWSNAGVVVLALPQPSQSFDFTLSAHNGIVNLGVGFWNLTDPSTPSPAPPAQFNIQPTLADSGTFDHTSAWPLTVNAVGSSTTGLFRLECFGTCYLEMPMANGAGGPKPAEAAVWRSTWRDNHGQIQPTYGTGLDHMFFYARPRDPTATATLRFTGTLGKYDAYPSGALPAHVRVRDGAGNVVLDDTVFAFGARSDRAVTLDPAINPLPWEIETLAVYGPRMAVEGVDELFISSSPVEIDAVVNALSP